MLMVCGKCLLLYDMQEHICKKIECFVLLLNIAWLLLKIYVWQFLHLHLLNPFCEKWQRKFHAIFVQNVDSNSGKTAAM